MRLLLIIFLVGCAAAAAGVCAAYNISTEAKSGTGYCFFLLRFCPLHCDASGMDVECAAVETGRMLEKYMKSFSPSTLLLLSFASILLLLLLLRRDMHFCFLVEVLLLLIISLVGCAAAAASACAAYNISAEAERGTGYCFFLLRFCLYTAMLRTSIAAVVLGCFYFCLLD